jgi:non-ribosomal peptide synthetase component E (peptide arylation enzyme)
MLVHLPKGVDLFMHKFYLLTLGIPVVAGSLTVSQLPVFAQNRDVAVVLKEQQQALSGEAIKNAMPHRNSLAPLHLPISRQPPKQNLARIH